jgi:hypothetical protein
MELYSDSGLRKELGFNGRKFYEDKLDVNIACRRICEQIDLIRT